ncbi:Alpha/Beta hydrolase protein [Tricharina praecox]|uniref:Alpha/Beta hydrolase protein n=1 Tax=Tricharina praecox TaxID=43433 RepID=UPI002220EC49|nr:Alpha/Beta hydrolase protein [Tricharina praecox]KAI5849727.1 Alpha/Beta hydrolase protein [Tricharina praecox]
MPFNTLTVALSTTPTIISTLFSYPLSRQRTDNYGLSYAEGIALIRKFLIHASHHTVEELQAFTAMYVPRPVWVCCEPVEIANEYCDRAAAALVAQLGEEGVKRVGGERWWRWREGKLMGEWVWVREKWWPGAEEVKEKEPQAKTMLYVHGGAYYFGSVDEHRYQLQRHARKIGARVFAPRYRLAPQFPFPCALYDVLACYLHLLSEQPAESIIFAGDSAGGGLLLSILCILRDQGLPQPAGAVLISPWVDLCHSFASVVADSSADYIPAHGFHHRPSAAWPPRRPRKNSTTGAYSDLDNERVLKVEIDGALLDIPDQIQLYTTNDMLRDPLVSPVNQPTLAGLCPLLILVGGGEILRDEQVYIAHRAAFPELFCPAGAKAAATVHLQVFPNACHVLPTLAWTRPAKRMCASVATFAAAVFADPSALPDFTHETVHTTTSTALPAMKPEDFPTPECIGVITAEPVKRWLAARRKWETKYPSTPPEGEEEEETPETWEGERPPPSAAVLKRGTEVKGKKTEEKISEGEMKNEKGWGMSLWAGWGAKSDSRRILEKDTEEQLQEDEERVEEEKERARSV